MASSSTSRLRRCSIRCRVRSDLSTVSTHTLGAAQVHGHGLVTPPVLGAVQWEFMALRTVYEMACFLVSFEGYVLVNMQYKFQLVQMTVVVLCLQFIDELDIPVCFYSANCASDRRVFHVLLLDRFLTCPLLCNATCTVLGRQGRRHLRRGADADSHGPDCSSDHRYFPVACGQGGASSTVAVVEKTVALSQLHLLSNSLRAALRGHLFWALYTGTGPEVVSTGTRPP